MTIKAEARSTGRGKASNVSLPGLLDQIWIPLAIRLAWYEGLFEHLARGPLTVDALAEATGFSPRGIDAVAGAAANAGLIRRRHRHGAELQLVPELAPQLLRGGRQSRYPMLTLCTRGEPHDGLSLRLQRALRMGLAQIDTPNGNWLALLSDAGDAKTFLQAMSAQALDLSVAWVQRLAWSGCRHLLDVGGGAGDHARAVLAHCPSVSATVFDLPAVVEAAHALGHRDAHRLRWHPGNFWRLPWPAADTHLFSDILHDWSPAQGLTLLRNSFEQLPKGGRVLVHEQLLDPLRDGPTDAIASNLAMLVWTEGQQYTALQLSELLCDAGFREVSVLRTLGTWCIATGIKT